MPLCYAAQRISLQSHEQRYDALFTTLNHTGFQGGSRFRSCACACFYVVYILHSMFCFAGVQGKSVHSFKNESLSIARVFLSKRQLSFASGSLFSEKVPSNKQNAPVKVEWRKFSSCARSCSEMIIMIETHPSALMDFLYSAQLTFLLQAFSTKERNFHVSIYNARFYPFSSWFCIGIGI